MMTGINSSTTGRVHREVDRTARQRLRGRPTPDRRLHCVVVMALGQENLLRRVIFVIFLREPFERGRHGDGRVDPAGLVAVAQGRGSSDPAPPLPLRVPAT